MMELVMRAYKFKSAEERRADLKNTLITAIKKGDNVSKIIEILAVSSDFYKDSFPLDWKNVEQNKVMVDFFARKERMDLENPPAFVNVPFAYFMLKHNQSTLLQRLIHDADNDHPNYRKPMITIPYRFVNDKDENGKPIVAVYYLPKYDGTEKSDATRQKLNVAENSMQYFYYLNLPNYISLLSRQQILDQLRPFYLKDQAVLEFARKLKEYRHIDLINGSTNLKPIEERKYDDTKNAYGFGVTLTDSEQWERMEAERKRFEAEHPELVNAK